MDFTALLLAALGLYLLCGLIFAIPFALAGVSRIDSHAAQGSWGFRLLIVPGAAFLWPILARRWMKGFRSPPEETNAHRRAACQSSSSAEPKDLPGAEKRSCHATPAGSRAKERITP